MTSNVLLTRSFTSQAEYVYVYLYTEIPLGARY